MSQSEDTEDAIKAKHEELCSQLNVDSAAILQSWESYTSISQNYTLDGEPLHWLSCALYVACRNSITPTVELGKAVEGNCVSLTKLLRLCNISLIQFFNKIKKWMEMASMSEEFRVRIERLERKFAVSTVLFQKFQPIFHDLFTGFTNDITKSATKASKKQKLMPCTTNALFEFSWCLFICVKGEFHSSADDLVDMYHILLSCLDFVYANAFMSHRTDLINPKFAGLPPDWSSDSFVIPKEPPCIISEICKSREGLPLEASTTKQYSWRPVIVNFFQKGNLKGDEDKLTGLLDIGNFDVNLKSLNNLYETYVLSVGEFDERIFLGEHANTDIGTPNKMSGDEISKTIATFGTSGRSHAPDTPLTGRKYLRGRENLSLTPVSAATHSIARLRAYLSQCKPQPSPQLLLLFSESGVDEASVNTNVIQPCQKWADMFLEATKESKIMSTETATSRCNMITSLHYKVLEQILREEQRKKPQVPLPTLLSQEIFQLTLYACSAEIVLHAYGAHSMRFPWVLNVFQLSAFHFYKIIELVVQVVMDKLSRDIIKHLNAVEETALESLVWAGDSPLWARLSSGVPASTDVYPDTAAPAHTAAAIAQRRLPGGMQSPVSSATERFLTPMVDVAKKQLFRDTPIRPGQSLLVPPTGGVIVANSSAANTQGSQETPVETTAPATSSPTSTQPGNQPASQPAIQPASQPASQPGSQPATPAPPTPGALTPTRSNSKGSLVLFFRKFYSLAVVRMNHLCTTLKLTDSELKRKIWTCLEYSIMHQTHLMRDRHLDQVLMCAVYVICKVSNTATNRLERTFTEIMKCYRMQPQADNHVYRSVLIGPLERGDLIKFYNKVYVPCMQTFAFRFAGRQRDDCSLSPLPAGRGESCVSPAGQRVSDRHHLYVKPLTTPPPANHQLTYRFSRSPAKDLRAINTMLSCEVSSGVKRAAEQTADDAGVVKRAYGGPGVARKLHGLITDRQAV